MKDIKAALFFSLLVYFSNVYAEQTVQFSSNDKQNIMVELFTSQGCSSCPPAEHWLNGFEHNEKLWNEIVPIAFHVDYWDNLGWPDPYAKHAYSARQYRHQQQDHIRSVYTPGVLANGQEWRGWIRGKNFPKVINNAGILSFNANPKTIEVAYSKASKENILNIALLGIGIKTRVERGENKGKVLQQNFVALSHDIYSAGKSDGEGKWVIPLPPDTFNHAQRYALAVWISSIDDIAPVQSTGYWLPNEWFE